MGVGPAVVDHHSGCKDDDLEEYEKGNDPSIAGDPPGTGFKEGQPLRFLLEILDGIEEKRRLLWLDVDLGVGF